MPDHERRVTCRSADRGHSDFLNLKQEDRGSERLSSRLRVLEGLGVQCPHRILKVGEVRFEDPASFSGLRSWTHE